ncbi:MAG: saccharopine dehydrogenase NADP-binding domain-containing protein [Elusimicrobia bacterium]|nr:saccharopine dehydrogenase NADP-binding domain-containing protein [Elusimicrobiota bacterium]
MRIIVLGTGLVGAAMARDLAEEKNWNISVADVSTESLKRLQNDGRITKIQADLSKAKTLLKLASKSDLIIGALPGFMGFEALKTLISAGKNIVDISFFPENPMVLDALAKKKGVTAIVDCGVAPGCSNMLIAYACSRMEKTNSAACYVGGLPKTRTWPYEYKAVFSPIDVLEEYTRPARYVENGKIVVKPALSEPELLDFPPIGTLEAFNTDGLRTLMDTMDIPDMKEKTLRYPGHIEKMKVLRETGFFGKNEIKIGKKSVRPMEVTARLLFPLWKLEEGEADFTVMRITVEGTKNSKTVRYTCELYDEYDPAAKTTSMARTTGYAATSAARMLASGIFKRRGICPPEYIGMEEKACRFMLKQMAGKNINYKERFETIKTARQQETCREAGKGRHCPQSVPVGRHSARHLMSRRLVVPRALRAACPSAPGG